MMSHSFDPLRHPDLIELSRRMRTDLERILDAEQAAAAAVYFRNRSLRDRLIEAEDRSEHAAIWTVDGRCQSGLILAVGLDHVKLAEGSLTQYVLLHQITGIEIGPSR